MGEQLVGGIYIKEESRPFSPVCQVMTPTGSVAARNSLGQLEGLKGLSVATIADQVVATKIPYTVAGEPDSTPKPR